ncbi:DUF1499 domain-containing protein [Pseudemcibacter aquimaris]|uniref:DUF1499 domain-containing protein n=1 Tax=Pseudemcibacter aquimaris TaxID=2857064 RepID=UPI00201132E3|nr:DUF1499 domain-containing protein [Pseudemcibacter aquimaris]MCC3862586.1 DUF1499 domain-containing protein [Pseudemcibacter aquimaris]WDU57896.1 DUF1499 domain-containing protein [Pseudemcibacter aquimaris]
MGSMYIGKRKTSLLATIIFYLALLGGAAILVMLFGAFIGLWEPIDGFIYYRRSFEYIGYVVVGLSVATLGYLSTKKHLIGKKKAVVALLIGLGILYPTIKSTVTESISYPPIHDITTDTVNPPEFVALTDPRPGSRNTLSYFNKPERQEWYPSRQLEFAAYADIKPIMSNLSPDEAYAKALSVGQAMGWEIIGADPVAHRFEGTAVTPVFRFVDDTVVVVTARDGGSRIDVRSVSRIGVGDIGVNAARIREFITRFNG